MFMHDADLWDRVANGALVDFSTYAADEGLLDPDDKILRELYVTDTAMSEISNLPSDQRSLLLAEMVQFATGGQVTWGDPRKGNHLKPLDPLSGWAEFKVRQRPQTRMFGGFVRIDTFVAVKVCLRNEVPEDCASVLDGLWQGLWAEDVPRCEISDPSALLTNYLVLR